MRDNDWLNGVMEFDHPVRVNEDGSVTGRGVQVYAPESVVMTTHDGSVLKEHEDQWTETMRAAGWEPERGWTGQYGYSGPFMHPSEYIGGALAGHILSTPGVWVAVAVECLRGDPGPDDLECVYCGVSLNESDTGLWEDADAPPSADRDSARYCDEAADHLHAPEFDEEEDPEPAGWAVLHMDDTAETESYVVKVGTDDVTPAYVHHAAKVALARAREIATAATSPARIIRVTDLAILPNEE